MHKQMALMGVLLLSGCSTSSSMLDVAPAYPPIPGFEFSSASGVPQTRMMASNTVVEEPEPKVLGPYGQLRNQSMIDLAAELRRQGIPFRYDGDNEQVLMILEKIRFNTSSSKLGMDGKATLNQLANIIRPLNDLVVVIDGHTDDIGNEMMNFPLSEKRASTVRYHLLQQHLDPENIYSRGFGEHTPACDNGSSAGRQCNRRVEITFIGQD